jgi:WD40 repeat protein
VRVLEGHTDDVNVVAYSPDGAFVASSSDDHTIRVWDTLNEGRRVLRYIRQKDSNNQHTGWVLPPAEPSAYLMFVSPLSRLPDDTNVLTLPKSAVPHVDLSNAKFGDRWSECYTPTVT